MTSARSSVDGVSRFLCSSLVAGACLLLATPARGDDYPIVITGERMQLLYDNGRAAYDAGNFIEGMQLLSVYRELYRQARIIHDPVFIRDLDDAINYARHSLFSESIAADNLWDELQRCQARGSNSRYETGSASVRPRPGADRPPLPRYAPRVR